MRLFFFALMLLASPASAAPMTAAEFEAYTTGKTLFFARAGTAYGAEQYLENRRVRWSFLDGDCKNGVWYDDEPLICFVYDDAPDPQCWTFERGANGLIARFEGGVDGQELYEAQDLGEEMVCLGPEVGVSFPVEPLE